MTMLQSRNLMRFGAATVVASVFLMSCGGGGATGGAKVDAQAALTDLIVEEPSAAQAGSKTSDVSCSGPAPSEFGSGELCVDSGYRQDSKFSFANWGNYQYTGDTFNADEFVTLFGAANVCISGTAENCVLTTKSQARLDLLNKQVAGGRCEGMVVMSALLAAGAVKLEDLQSGAKSVSDLDPNDPKLLKQINYWWATQFSPKVLADTEIIRGKGIKGVLDGALKGLRKGVFATMGIYTKSSGHALLPVGVTRASDGTFNIIVYDSNLPDQLSRVVIDPVKETWIYLEGAVTPGQATGGWSGTSGTIELTPLISREGGSACEFCDDKSASQVKVNAQLIPLPAGELFNSLFKPAAE
jgi:hypothetical protein